MQLDTYVISLPRAVERRRYVAQMYQCFADRLKVIDAVDARDFTQAQISEMIDPERRGWVNYLRAGAVCCALSHMKAYREFLASSAERCLVLEDDAELLVTKARFEEVVDSLVKTEFDVVCLNSFSPTVVVLNRVLETSAGVGVYVAADGTSPGSGLSYVLNRHAAAQIIRYQCPIRDAADAWQSYSDAIGIRVGFVKPDLFEPFNFESTIDYVRRDGLARRLTPRWVRNFRRWLAHRRMKKNVVLK